MISFGGFFLGFVHRRCGFFDDFLGRLFSGFFRFAGSCSRFLRETVSKSLRSLSLLRGEGSLFSFFLLCELGGKRVGFDFVRIRNAFRVEEFVVDDVGGLEILQRVVQGVVILGDVVLPDFIGDGVVLRQAEVFLQLAGVLVGEHEVHRRAVLDRVEDGFVDVTFHVGRGAGEDLGSVVDHSEERDGFGGLGVLRGGQGRVQDDVRILHGKRVAGLDHDAVKVCVEAFKEFNGEFLVVLAVVRFVLVEVGVEVRAEGGNRDGIRAVAEVLGSELVVQSLEVARGDRDGEGPVEGLGRGVIRASRGVAVVDGADGVASERDAVEELLVADVNEVKVRIDIEVVLVRILDQVFEALVAADDADPFQTVRDRRVHTAVGIAGELEVDVRDAALGELGVDGLDVLKRGEGRVDLHREGEDSLRRLDGTEGLDEERDIRLDVGVGELGEVAAGGQVIAVRGRHAGPVGLVGVLEALLLRHLLIVEEDVLDAVGAGVLSLGGHRPGCGTGDGDGVREVVFVGRTGRELRVDRVVRVERTAAFRHEGGQGVALGDDREEAVVVSGRFFDGSRRSSGTSHPWQDI